MDPLEHDTFAQPRCATCGTLLRDVVGGWQCKTCGKVLSAPKVRMPAAFEGPSIYGG